jgi:ribosome-binding factor A
MSNRRLEKINSQIVSQVSELLLFKSKDPRLQAVNITRALVSGDLKKCRLFYSVLGESKEREDAETALKKAAGFIRSRLAGQLGLKSVPELAFSFDRNVEYAQHIKELLTDLVPPESLEGSVDPEEPLPDKEAESQDTHAPGDRS